MKSLKSNAIVLLVLAFVAVSSQAAEKGKYPGYLDTPIITGQKWRVHDANRPQPPVITPGQPSTQEKAGTAPSDATVLFDGTNLDQFQNKSWKIVDGAMVVGKGTQKTVKKFKGDLQIHIEFNFPESNKTSQGRNNSGIFLMGRYEVQILDCFKNVTYADGMTAAIYGQQPPQINACKPQGQWQTYDILWTAPVFKDGEVVKKAAVTVFVNGVLAQHNTEFKWPSTHKRLNKYKPHAEEETINFQDHGNPVKFRNMWVREINKPEPSE